MRGLMRPPIIAANVILGISLLAIGPSPAAAQSASFVAPPRTIADITAILDQEKPDPSRRWRDCAPRADAKAAGGSGGRGELARFYYSRCMAAEQPGRVPQGDRGL